MSSEEGHLMLLEFARCFSLYAFSSIYLRLTQPKNQNCSGLPGEWEFTVENVQFRVHVRAVRVLIHHSASRLDGYSIFLDRY